MMFWKAGCNCFQIIEFSLTRTLSKTISVLDPKGPQKEKENPASAGTPVPELAKAFIVPKGCMVKINAAIWHLCPLPVHNDVLHAMIILPECTYANDCTVVEFEEKDWFKIV